MRRITLAVLWAVCLAGCGGEGEGVAKVVEVPDLIGMESRPASELLAQRGLRWKYLGGRQVHAAPPPDNVWSTADDDFIVEQEPDAGEPAQRGTVIVLEVSCSMEPLPPGSVCID
jgi:beta-lactam-binding protein with PASTA domain